MVPKAATRFLHQIRIAFLCALSLLAWPPTLQAEARAAETAAGLERVFEQFFLFTTEGAGDYSVYQRIEDRLGTTSADEIVCMLRQCYVLVLDVPDSGFDLAAKTDLPRIRARLKTIMDAYSELRAAPPDAKKPLIAAWRHAIADAKRCFADHATC